MCVHIHICICMGIVIQIYNIYNNVHTNIYMHMYVYMTKFYSIMLILIFYNLY